MNITNEYERKQRSDKLARVMHSPICMWTAIILCPVWLILGGTVNIISNITDCIRKKRKKNKQKIHPKKRKNDVPILDKIEIET
jgi:hypothetical protein